MAPLQLQLFGTLQAFAPDPGTELRIAGRPAELLGFLSLHRSRRHARARVAGLLWGEQREESARRCLSTALWRLRKTLEPALPPGAHVFLVGRSEIGFHPGSAVRLDVAEFEAAMPAPGTASTGTGGLSRERAAEVERGLDLHRGELLEGMYHDWVQRERARLAALRLAGLSALFRFHRERGELARALQRGEEILREEPFHESVLRDLMRLHVRAGRRAMALDLYERQRMLLREELGADPMEETRTLASRIRTVGSLGPEPPSRAPYTGLVQSLRTAERDLRVARSRVRRAVEAIEGDEASEPGSRSPGGSG